MKKLLIIALLFVGCVFGDTIKWQDSNAKDKGKTYDIANVEFLYTKYNRLYYLDYRGEKVVIECSWVISITDSEGNKIEFNCDDDSSETYEEETKIESSEDVQSIIQNTEKPLVGGLFILLGSGILLVNTGNECNECDSLDDVEDFANEIKTQNQLGYLFIAIGGAMITLGI